MKRLLSKGVNDQNNNVFFLCLSFNVTTACWLCPFILYLMVYFDLVFVCVGLRVPLLELKIPTPKDGQHLNGDVSRLDGMKHLTYLVLREFPLGK